MQRNTNFKPGRGSKMLEQLMNKKNTDTNVRNESSTENIDLFPLTKDCCKCDEDPSTRYQDISTDEDLFSDSKDIIEGTPSPTPPMKNHKRIISPDSDDELDEHKQVTFDIKITEDNENVSPSLLIRSEQLSELISQEQSSPFNINYGNDEHTCLAEDLYLSDDSIADPDWKSPEDNITTRKNDIDSDTDNAEFEKKKAKKIKTTRWHKRKEETYDRNAQKKNRSLCLPYKNYKKQIQPPKAPKSGDCKCKLNCTEHFTDEERNQICKSYWGLSDYNRQKDFILMNVEANAPQRRLVNASKKRTVSRSYFLKNGERQIKVCEKFFKNTLCISNGPINKAFSEVGSSGVFEGQDKRGKHEAHNKTKQEDVDFVKEHIESFPFMLSHYCRKTSSKEYLDSNLSISKMYELYEEKCKSASRPTVSINVYRNIFCTQYNKDFYKPKKPAKCESDSRTEGSVQTCKVYKVRSLRQSSHNYGIFIAK